MARKARITASAAGIQPRSDLDGRTSVHAGASVTVMPGASRLSLRAPFDSAGALSTALGLSLPDRPKTSTRDGQRAALWLGPDEWFVIDDSGMDLNAAVRSVAAFHSAVDISHRNIGIRVFGRSAQATINAGCPQDLSLTAFPVGACSRTVLAKIEIVLWRTADQEFRVECWRSFADYAFTLLDEAARAAPT